MGHSLCCLSTLISGVKARGGFATPWWLQQHCDTHTWGVTLTCQVSRHVAPVVILAPTRGSLHANFDIDLAVPWNLYLCDHVIISTQWSLKVMSHDYNNYNNYCPPPRLASLKKIYSHNVYNIVDLSSMEKKKESYTTGKLPTSHQTGESK